MDKPSITQKRLRYKPFEFPEVMKFVDMINKTFWVHSEVDFTADIQDFNTQLSPSEKEVVRRSLLGIAQIEIGVKSFWGKLHDHLPKPEFNCLGSTFAECYIEGTEVLTPKGWVDFRDLQRGELVGSFDKERNFVFEKPSYYIKKHYEGNIVKLSNKDTVSFITPSHKLTLYDKYGYEYHQEVSKVDFTDKDIHIPNSIRSLDFINIKKRDIHQFHLSSIVMAISTLGTLCDKPYDKKGKESYRITLTKVEHIEKFNTLLQNVKDLDYEKIEEKINYSDGRPTKTAVIYKIWLDQTYYHNVFDFEWVTNNLEVQNLPNYIISEYIYWNSQNLIKSEGGSFVIHCLTSSGATRLQTIGTLAGYKVFIDKDYLTGVIKVYFNRVEGTIPVGNLKKESFSYEGNVYCVTVPSTGNIITRYDKHIFLSGNCEVRHSEAYSKLINVLGYDNDFNNLLEVPAIKNRMVAMEDEMSGMTDFISKLLFFTIFIENTSLFSQFANILSFTRFEGRMKNVSNIISWTSVDEQCFPEGTQVLTPKGWQLISEMKVEDSIYGFKGGILKEEKVLKTIKKPYEGNLIKTQNLNQVIVTTPDHDMIYLEGNVWKKQKAGDMEYIEDIALPVSTKFESSVSIKKLSDLDKLRLILSFNNSFSYDKGSNTYAGKIYGKEFIKILTDLLTKLGIQFSAVSSSRNGEVGNLFIITLETKNDYTNLSWVYEGDYLKSKEWCDLFIRELNEWGSNFFFTLENEAIIQHIAVLGGFKLDLQESNGVRRFSFRFPELGIENGLLFSKEVVESYSGEVSCVTVPSGGIVVKMDGGLPFIAGNCHAEAGLWIINQFQKEGLLKKSTFNSEYLKGVFDKLIKSEIELLDWIYEEGELKHFTKEDMVNFMKYRIDESLVKLNLDKIYSITSEQYRPMKWFEEEIFSHSQVDFFASRPTDYTKHDKSITANDLF